jgi:hypothetical protein
MAEIGNYMDGAVAAEIRLQLETHLSHCHTCQVVYDSAKKTVRVLTDCGSFDFPETASRPITERVIAAIRGQRRSS